jgi:hypothetical protein
MSVIVCDQLTGLTRPNSEPRDWLLDHNGALFCVSNQHSPDHRVHHSLNLAMTKLTDTSARRGAEVSNIAAAKSNPIAAITSRR